MVGDWGDNLDNIERYQKMKMYVPVLALSSVAFIFVKNNIARVGIVSVCALVLSGKLDKQLEFLIELY